MTSATPLDTWRDALITRLGRQGVDRVSAEEIADELLDHLEARLEAGESPAVPTETSVDELLEQYGGLSAASEAADQLGSDLRRARRARRWRDMLSIPSILLLAFVAVSIWNVSWALRVDATDRFIMRFQDKDAGIDSVMPWFAYRGTAGTILAWTEIAVIAIATVVFFLGRRPWRRAGLSVLFLWALLWFIAAARQSFHAPGFFAPFAAGYAVAVGALIIRWWIRLPAWAER